MVDRVAGTIAELGPRGRLLRDRRRRRRLRGRADLDPGQPEGGLQLARSGSTSAGASTRSARPASSSASRTTWSRSSAGTPRRGSSSRAAPAPGSTSPRSAAPKEPLSKGGTASGPVSFMRGADSWAGAIKSGGGTRRAAKMVVLDVDHPDIEKFIWCKADEEKKAAALRDAGFDMRLDSEAFASVQFQNANNSVRVTDEFMQAAADDADWDLVNRVDGSVGEDACTARDLLEPDRRRRLAVRRPGRPVRLDHQPLAHLPGVRADQRLEPVLRVHARRRLGLQPRLAQPDEVPQRGRHLQRRRLHPRGGHRLPRAGDHRRPVELPDRADRRERAARSASSGWATPTSARC